MSSIQLRPYQAQGVEAIRASFKAKNRAVLYVLPTGGGKCLGAGAPVLMFDGSVKAVENIVIGDLLMGPDSLPRTVLSLASGNEMLYRVTPIKGDSYVVNESHILSLKRTKIRSEPKYLSQQGGEVVNIGVLDYLASSQTFKHEHKGWRAAVDFPPCEAVDVIEPYFLGVWLGDGHSHVAEITTGDEEIISYVTAYAKRLGMKAVTHQNSVNSIGIRIIGHALTGRGGTTIMNALRSYDLCKNKHIPHRWKTGSRTERLELLAGLIDSDGSYTGKGFDVSLKSEVLMDDLIFVARSLGFSAYKSACRKTCHNNGVTGDYWRCNISGDVERIPCKIPRKMANPRLQKKSPLVTGISVEAIGDGDYYGFEIDGDHLFMLGDFTVTHNTFTFSYVADGATKKQNKVLILVHRKELLMQASMSLAKMGLKHCLIAQTEHIREIQHQQLSELGRLYLSETAKIAIASVGTLVNRLSTTWAPDLIIPDEAHHCQKDNTWGKILSFYDNARILGVTATPIRSDGKGMGVDFGGLFNDLVVGPSMSELIQLGYLLPSTVYAPPTALDLTGVRYGSGGKDFIQKELVEAVDKPVITGSAVKHYGKLCPGLQALAFCVSVQHAEHVAADFRSAGWKFQSIDGTMHSAQRRSLIHGLTTGRLDGLSSCDIVSEGTDIPVVGCGILLRPTQSTGLHMQQVGRILRPFEGQDRAIVLDHVGNCAKHGLPEEDREWSLSGEVKRGTKKNEVNIRVLQCDTCWVTFAPAPQCPNCGTAVEFKGRVVDEVDGELQRVEAEQAAQMKRNRAYEQSKAKTLEELVELAKAKRYKNPHAWARHILHGRAAKQGAKA